MLFWTSAKQVVAARMDLMRDAERRLLEFAQSSAGPSVTIQAFDTLIPKSRVPAIVQQNDDEDESLTIHGVKVISSGSHVDTPGAVNDNPFQKGNKSNDAPPLVLLHGYANASAYFYRNFAGLSRHFSTIFSLDMLGWGLSSRPSFTTGLQDKSMETAEDFFVESLEAWRDQQQIPKMILAGHSMGGYISVAYTERYPERVERLLLLSPVGVPDETDPGYQDRIKRFSSSIRSRLFIGTFRTLFDMTTVGSVFRNVLSEERGYGMAKRYVTGRLPELNRPGEAEALTDYLYHNSVLPGSGEYAIHRFLKSNIMAHKPLQDRIPLLQVKNVDFAYGSHDWMDLSGGLKTQELCRDKASGGKTSPPQVNVYEVPNAGHLLMLQNSEATNDFLIHAAGGVIPSDRVPRLVEPKAYHQQQELQQQVAQPAQ